MGLQTSFLLDGQKHFEWSLESYPMNNFYVGLYIGFDLILILITKYLWS